MILGYLWSQIGEKSFTKITENYNTDFYKGIFQSYFVWCADYSDGGCNDFRTEPDPSEYSGFSYGYMNGPLGFTWGINWAKW